MPGNQSRRDTLGETIDDLGVTKNTNPVHPACENWIRVYFVCAASDSAEHSMELLQWCGFGNKSFQNSISSLFYTLPWWWWDGSSTSRCTSRTTRLYSNHFWTLLKLWKKNSNSKHSKRFKTIVKSSYVFSAKISGLPPPPPHPSQNPGLDISSPLRARKILG